MAKHGFMTVLKGAAMAAFLTVAMPDEAPAQGFDIANPNSITNPMHPLSPLNPASPTSIYEDRKSTRLNSSH